MVMVNSDETPIDPQGWNRTSVLVITGLTFTSFFNYMDRMAVAVLIEPIKRALSLSDTQAGLITGLAFALFYAVMGVPIARLADRRNKSMILVTCFLAWSAVTALSGLATSFLSLFILRLLVGVGEAGCLPTSFAIISERFHPRQLPLAISLFQAGGRLGVALGMACAGIAAELVGWRVTLVAVGLAGVPVAFMVALLLRGSDVKRPTAGVPESKASLRVILLYPGFLRLICAISLASFGTYGITQWMAAFFVRSHGATLGEAGVLIGTSSGIGGFAGTLAGGAAAGVLIRRHQNWDLWVPAIAYFMAMPLFLAALFAPTKVASSSIYFIATLVCTAGGGVALAAVQRFTQSTHRATANALMLMISALTGVGLGPVAVGILSDLLSAHFGVDSLRCALGLSTFAFFGASILFVFTASGPKKQDSIRTLAHEV
jgi:predicted MFS family arabinose efflux permease